MSETFACPNCGYKLEVGTPTCGNCGTILQGGSAVPPPLAATGIRPGTVITWLVVLGLVGGVFFARERIGDLFESAGDAIDDAAEDFAEEGPVVPGGGGGEGRGGGREGGGGGGKDGGGVEIGYRRVAQVVRDIRAGGIPCTSMAVDYSDEFLETGSCQSAGSHVQINIYFDPAAIQQAREFYEGFAFASVHDTNWWVSGETTLMARIQKAIGGRLNRPPQ